MLDVQMHIIIHGTRAFNTGAVLNESLQKDFRLAYNEMRDLALGLVAPIPRSALAHEANKAQA
jgi:hypothetical protein